jgi:hypothetical protein
VDVRFCTYYVFKRIKQTIFGFQALKVVGRFEGVTELAQSWKEERGGGL